jgi:hypothetical protein
MVVSVFFFAAACVVIDGARVDEDPAQVQQSQEIAEQAAQAAYDDGTVQQEVAADEQSVEEEAEPEEEEAAPAKKQGKVLAALKAKHNADQVRLESIITKSATETAKLDKRYSEYAKAGAEERKAKAVKAAKLSKEDETEKLAEQKDSAEHLCATVKEMDDTADEADGARVGAAIARREHVDARETASPSHRAATLALEDLASASEKADVTAADHATSEATLNAGKEALHAAAEGASKALVAHHLSQKALAAARKTATTAKLETKAAVERKKAAEAAVEKAAQLVAQAAKATEESAWADHGAMDALASKTSKAFSAFTKHHQSHEAAKHMVTTHRDASSKLVAAKVSMDLTQKHALEASTPPQEAQEADAEQEEEEASTAEVEE